MEESGEASLSFLEKRSENVDVRLDIDVGIIYN